MENGIVKSLSKSDRHTFNKFNCDQLTLLQGLGVQGDAHMGTTVKHRSRVAKDPNQPNLRQVHLIHAELFEELEQRGFTVKDGEMGENITTRGIPLLDLPKDTILKIGEAQIQVTGLRNPCSQINGIQPGLMNAVLDKDAHGNLIRKSGIMGVVLEGGDIKVADAIEVVLPEEPHQHLEPV
ncbi:MAG: MOSC domain-containing protein [Gilvibacter sp.]